MSTGSRTSFSASASTFRGPPGEASTSSACWVVAPRSFASPISSLASRALVEAIFAPVCGVAWPFHPFPPGIFAVCWKSRPFFSQKSAQSSRIELWIWFEYEGQRKSKLEGRGARERSCVGKPRVQGSEGTHAGQQARDRRSCEREPEHLNCESVARPDPPARLVSVRETLEPSAGGIAAPRRQNLNRPLGPQGNES